MTREEAICRIENHIRIHSRQEQFRAVYITEALEMAVDALKAQEPRVMTLEEYKALAEKPKEGRDPVCEEWRGLKCTWKIPDQPYGGYGTIWRCWTSRPDQATREATPWN